jgi:hypothetical protein
MSRLDQLEASYRHHVAIPLKSGLPVAERIWFVVYAPEDERRLRNRITEFEIATTDAGLGWRDVDLTGAFAEWIDTYYEDVDERRSVLADPDLVESHAQTAFRDHLVDRIRAVTAAVPEEEAERTVIAFHGLMELYDFIHVSQVMDGLGKEIRGILLLFFPGSRTGNSYRFLGARDGWDYLATPILAE